MMQTFHTFSSSAAAREYRYVYGTGGWIFECEATGAAVLFPSHMPPTAIFMHPLTAGKSGRLIG
jgi:hypothetical protein